MCPLRLISSQLDDLLTFDDRRLFLERSKLRAVYVWSSKSDAEK